MDFLFSEDQIALREGTLRFAKESLNIIDPGLESSQFPRGAWEKCAEYGLLGLLVPTEFGGSGQDALTAAIVLDALGYGCRDHGLIHAICTQMLCGTQIGTYGTQEQREAYLPDLAAGRKIFCQAMTEPDAGSDTAAIRTKAERRGLNYVITGRKTFISNAPIADMALVFAVTDPEARVVGRTSCFIVPTTSPACCRGSPQRKMGLHSLQNGDLLFEDCLVSAEMRIGPEGAGSILFAESMEWERILLFATHLGKLQHVFERTVDYAKTRKQFGRHIGGFQAVSHKIAEMRLNLELGRLIAYKSAWLKAQGSRTTLESAMTKLFVSEACKSACIDALQLHGASGYMIELGLESELRDSIAGTIYSGTSEIQKNIIATLCGL